MTMAASSGKTVAVIGAGASGLVAAKCMVDVGLLPTVFDNQPEIGGMWNPISKRCWDSMETNMCWYTSHFSDFPPDAETFPGFASLYPTQREMFEYLDKYSSKFLQPEHFALRTQVKDVSRRRDDGKWVVQWSSESDEQRQDEFDFAVFATGIYCTPYSPTLPGLDAFKGEVLHSCHYYNPEKFVGKRVLVLGTSFSAVGVASDIALGGGHVVTVGRRRVWVLSRWMTADPLSAAPPFIPAEAVLCTYSTANFAPGSLAHLNARANGYFRMLCGDQGPLTIDPEHDKDPPYFTCSDNFMELVRSGQIDMRIGSVRELRGNAVVLDDGSVLDDIDFVILCTGYRTSISYLSKEVLDGLSFDPMDASLPLLLDRGTFHPSIPGAAFIGCYGGTGLTSLELQARWAAAVFSGVSPPVPESVQLEGITAIKEIRDLPLRPQFPFEDYLRFCASIAKEINAMPSPEFRAAHDVLIPPHFSQGAAAEAATVAFEKALEEFMDGKMVPHGVFRAIAGNWTFKRRIENHFDPAQSGAVTGTASFTATGQQATEYLYSETGELVLSGGVKCQVYRKYFYVYDTAGHRIDVFFENDGARGPLFHSLHFLPRESPTVAEDAKDASRPLASSYDKGWRAEGHHLSVKDVYSPSYLFQFSGNFIAKMEISHAVDGPQKKYTSTATYVR